VETLVEVHSGVRWLVLLALLAGAVVGIYRARTGAAWESGLFQIGVIALDVQVLIGIVIWIVDDAWSETFFYKIIHPGVMLVALAVAHVGLVLAKRRDDDRSNMLTGGSFILALVMITAAIPWDRL